jgi:hypothetical protein
MWVSDDGIGQCYSAPPRLALARAESMKVNFTVCESIPAQWPIVQRETLFRLFD